MKKIYKIYKTEKPDWDKIEGVKLNHTQWLPATDIKAFAKMAYNDEKLFIRLEAEEKNIREELTGPYEMVCNDSCLEFFFAPDPKDDRYLNFEWNPKGTLYLGFGIDRILRSRQLVDNAEKHFCPKPFRTENGWGVEFEIPCSFIKLYFPDFTPLGESHGNFYKCGDETIVPHYLSWSDMTGANPDFHRKCDFGIIKYE